MVKSCCTQDYPFSSQQGINLQNFPPELCFGCEYLCCVDEFSELNGATVSLSPACGPCVRR